MQVCVSGQTCAKSCLSSRHQDATLPWVSLVAIAAAKSEQEVIKEYTQVYRAANDEGDPWEPPHIL